MDEQKNGLTHRKAWKLTAKAWKVWWNLCPGVFLANLCYAAVKALTPYTAIFLSARLINELSGSKAPENLYFLVIISLVCAAALAFLSGVLGRWADYENSRAKRFEDRIYIEKMFSLDYVDIDRQYVFDLYSRIIQNENWGNWGIFASLIYFEKLALNFIQILGGIGLCAGLFAVKIPGSGPLSWLNHPACTAVILMLTFMAALCSSWCINKTYHFWTDNAENVCLGNRFFSFFGNISEEHKRAADIRIYRQQENVCTPYLKKEDMFGPGSAIARAAKGPMGLLVFAAFSMKALLVGAAYLFVCVKAWCGAIQIGSVTQYIGALTLLFTGAINFFNVAGKMRSNGYFLQDIFELLSIPNRMYKGSLTTEKRADRQYFVEFCDVSFKYPDTQQWVLRHVSLRFKVGSRLAVVGVNGSGKTTFIKLLCRLYDPTEGTILLNGIDIRKYNYDDYIQIFSVVFQDFKLLGLTLKENVAASARSDRAHVEKCLKDAGFKRLKTMPRGIDTVLYKELDDGGVEISGGEAQKIAIARALYKNTPFIILDEPTAALDPVAEAEIYSQLDDIVGDKTAIYISHRLSSCKFCDEIVVFDNGQIVQKGAHNVLVNDKNGKYIKLWMAQAKYYTKSGPACV